MNVKIYHLQDLSEFLILSIVKGINCKQTTGS